MRAADTGTMKRQTSRPQTRRHMVAKAYLIAKVWTRAAAAVTLLALMGFCLGGALAQVAQDPAQYENPVSGQSQTMIVLDGSGSMWGKLDNERLAKVDVIRERLTGILQAAPNARVALAAFGQRRRSDCSDAEILTAFDAPRSDVDAALLAFDPRGKGPLVEVLRKVSEAIGNARPMSVIAFTDSADNCRQDACAFASEFAATHPGVPIHLIGIGIGPKHKERLVCLPETTGGKFWNAATADEINAAIDDAAKVAMLAPGDTDAPAPTDASGGIVQAPSPQGVTMVRATLALSKGETPIALDANWSVRATGKDTVLAVANGATLAAKVQPGSYDIEAVVGISRAKGTAVVTEGKSTDLALALEVARIKARAVAIKGGMPSATALVTVEAKAAPEITKESSSKTTATAPSGGIGTHGAVETLVAPGSYTIIAIDGPVRVLKSIDVSAGDDLADDIIMETGRLDLSATENDGGPQLNNITFIVTADDPDSADGRREVARSRAANARFVLAAGTYYITARSGQSEIEERIAISAGDTVARTLTMPLVDIKVSARIAGTPATRDHGLVYRLTSRDGTKREVARSLNPILSARVAPGRYTVSALLDAHRLSAKRDIDVVAGTPVELVIDIDAAEVSLRTAAANTSPSADNFWEITDQAGTAVWRTMATAPIALLAPGRYTVTLEQRDRRVQAAFEAKNGEKSTVEVGANQP